MQRDTAERVNGAKHIAVACATGLGMKDRGPINIGLFRRHQNGLPRNRSLG